MTGQAYVQAVSRIASCLAWNVDVLHRGTRLLLTEGPVVLEGDEEFGYPGLAVEAK
jgi:hypothetical protein